MPTLSGSVMGDNNYYEARARDVNLDSITSEYNAIILEKLRNNDDSFKAMGIVEADYRWPEEDDFIVDVQEGEDLGWLGYFIGKNERLESLWISHLPEDKYFRQGLAQNQSIEELHLRDDLGKSGFQTLAPFLQNTHTLKKIHLSMLITSIECAQNIALLLSRCQMRSLKSLVFEENDLTGGGLEEIVRALRAQPQLEELILSPIRMEDAPFNQRGSAALGATMKHWISPSLKKLVINVNDHLNDDGLLALVEGMANCVNLEHLDLRRNGPITAVGLKALSSLFRSRKFCLQSLDLSAMDIDNEGMNTLASGLAAFHSLKSVTLSHNAIGDEGLKALAVGLSNSNNLETLSLSNNGPFSEVGLRCFSDVIPTALNLKELYLASSSINDEGLQALAVGLRKHPTLAKLDLECNAIGSEGLRALAAAAIGSLCWLKLARNAINDEALGVLAEGIENFRLETLDLSNNNMITSSGAAVLAPIFRLENSSLKEINLSRAKIEDSEAKAFAEALAGNESLARLFFDYTNLTASGWSEFSILLCDTSSVNSVYLSNHTLKEIGSISAPSSLQQYLRLNKQNEYDVPICKILKSYSELDMTSLLQWKLKLLPFVLAWFERAQSCRTYLKESIMKFERRELSALYQFIHGLPLLAASGFYKQMSTEAHSKKRKFDHSVE
jgi:Ran GTPase-activating protein (RanGAP) involved in mRNA processing and transport